jgi:hypothetical protein
LCVTARDLARNIARCFVLYPGLDQGNEGQRVCLLVDGVGGQFLVWMLGGDVPQVALNIASGNFPHLFFCHLLSPKVSGRPNKINWGSPPGWHQYRAEQQAEPFRRRNKPPPPTGNYDCAAA